MKLAGNAAERVDLPLTGPAHFSIVIGWATCEKNDIYSFILKETVIDTTFLSKEFNNNLGLDH